MDIAILSNLDSCKSISDGIRTIEENIEFNHGEKERMPESSIEVQAHQRYMRELYKVEELGNYALRLLDYETCAKKSKKYDSKVDSSSESSALMPRKGVGLLLEEMKARVHAITVGHKMESAERMNALKNHFKTCISFSIDNSNKKIADFGEHLAMYLAHQQSEINDTLLKSIQENSETRRRNEGSFENLEKIIEQKILSLTQMAEEFHLDIWSTNGSILQDLHTSTNRYFQNRFDTLKNTKEMRQVISEMDDTITALSKSRDTILSENIKLLPEYWEKNMQLEDLMQSVQRKEYKLTKRLQRLEQDDYIPPGCPSSRDMYAYKIIRHKQKEMNRVLRNLQDACSCTATYCAPEQKSILENITSNIHPITLSDSLIHDYLQTLLITAAEKHNQPDSLAAISHQYWESWLDQAFPLQYRQAMIKVLRKIEDQSRQR